MDAKMRFIFVNEVTIKTNYSIIFGDFQKDERVMVVENFHPIRSSVLRFLRRVHLSYKINSRIQLPLKTIWGNRLNDIDFDADTQYYIIFTNTSIFPISYKLINRLNALDNVHLILYLHDAIGTLNCKHGEEYIRHIKFDAIFTFDEHDAQTYGYTYYMVPYSCLQIEPHAVVNDIYYLGSGRGRCAQLHDLYSRCTELHLQSVFRLVNVAPEDQLHDSNIIYNKFITYDHSIEIVQSSNCIIEYIRDDQTGATLRYYEAVCYNKKLLTNNKNVVNLPFFDPDYMHVFETPEDIDWGWVKERIHVDYHYDGRFSPTRFIDRIIEMEEEKERRQNAQKETP